MNVCCAEVRIFLKALYTRCLFYVSLKKYVTFNFNRKGGKCGRNDRTLGMRHNDNVQLCTGLEAANAFGDK